METSGGQRGIALLLVIVVIGILTIIAVPFLSSMRMAEKSSKSFLERKRAEWLAQGALNHAIATLYETHDDIEHYNLLNGGGSGNGGAAFATPDSDSYDEIVVNPPQITLPGGDEVSFSNTRGEMWSATVTDEQSKVNVNSATPWLIANLVGVTELSASVKVEESVIPVTDPTLFYSDGDPDTIDGYVRIEHEYVAYKGVSEGALTGCMRGIFFEADDHPRGALVYDGRAFKISQHRANQGTGQLRLYSTPESVRDIAGWTKFDTIAEVLLYRQLYLDKLRDLGVDEKDIEEANLDLAKLVEPKKPDYTPDQAEVNKKLSELGFDSDQIRKLLGDDMVDLIGRRIPSGMSNNPRMQRRFEQIEQAFKEYIEEIEAEEQAKTDRLKKFLPQAFKNIKVLRELRMLEALSAIEFKKLESFITTYSWRARDWSRPVPIRSDVPQSGRGYMNRRAILVSDTRHFNRGTLIRIAGGGGVEYAVIAGRDRWGRIVTDSDLKGSYTTGMAYVQALLRHRVNINLCSDRVLKALLVGLRHEPFESDIRYIFGRGRQQRQQNEPDWITLDEAQALVEMIRESPPTSHADLAGILESAAASGIISQKDKIAVLTNAINPNDPSLVVSTTGFCYKSYNIFSIEASGIVSSPAGAEVARHSIREVIEIAPPRAVTWILDSQMDFSPGIVRHFDARTGRKSILQFDDRESNNIATTPDILITPWQFPSTSHDPGAGDMRIETGRLFDGNKYSNHYDDTLDGQVIDSGFQIETNSSFPMINQSSSNPRSIGTGYFSCWFKPNWAGGEHYFLDHAKGEYESRVVFYYDGSQLVLMVCDAGLDQEGQTLRASHTFESGKWYHVACSWKGVRYGDLAIMVDGKSVGTYENFTMLVGDIDARATQITVENASDLPLDLSGLATGAFPAIKIDSEAMNVVDVSGNTLTLQSQVEAATANPPPGWTPQLVRSSVRGTSPTYHRDGAVITVWGYRNQLQEDLRVGGAKTVYPLPATTPETIVQAPQQAAPPGGGPPPPDVSTTDTEIPVASTAEFPPEGFILIGQEIIYYAGTRTDKTGEKFTGCLRHMENTTAAEHSNGDTVKLISLKVTDTTDYKDSGYVQLNDEWIKYKKAEDPNYQKQYFIMPYAGGGGGAGGRRMRPRNPRRPGGGAFPGPGGGNTPRPPGGGGATPFPPGGGGTPTPPGGGEIPIPPGGGRPGPSPPGGSIILPGPEDNRCFPDANESILACWVGSGIGIFPQAVPPPGGPAIPVPGGSDTCRGQAGTTAAAHGANTDVIPVFDIQYEYCGRGDKVTVIDNSGKEMAAVNHTSGSMVALTAFVGRKYIKNDMGRLLKWPSGELPTEIQAAVTIGGSQIVRSGGIMSTIDEIDITTDGVHSPYASYGFVVNVSVGANETSLLYAPRQSHGGTDPPGGNPNMSRTGGGVPRLQQNGGLIKIDDEVIGVAEVDTGSGVFGRLKRGVLGTNPAPHAEGSRIYIIPYPKAGALDGGLTGDEIPCRDPGGTPRQGYIQVARTDGQGEIIPYRFRRGRALRRYYDVNGESVFRGAFGSPQTGFSAGDLGIYIPFRYHDLYEANVESRQGVYYYAAHRFNYAYFRSITWDATIPPGTVTKVQVRVDGQPDWSTAPSNKKGGIFEFTVPDGDNLIGVMGKQVEIRVYMTYQKDAYLGDGWKDTPVIRSITLEYDQPHIVHHHETTNE